MKPQRSPAHLAFIRSLPCCVSGRQHGVEAAHVGHRGMGQKCSDFETIPLNTLYHREQHRIGLKRFARTYDLDVLALLAMLNEKPYVSTLNCVSSHPPGICFVANYAGEFMPLGLVRDGLQKSMAILKDRVRESLSARILARVKQSQAG